MPELKSEVVLETAIDRFWETVPPVWNKIRSNIRAIAGENFEITVEQFHVLRHVRRGTRSVSDIATEKRISRSAVSQAVDNLVEKGLLNRIPSEIDRRCMELELTERGNELLDEIFHKNRAWMRTRLARLSPEQLQVLSQAIPLLRSAFQDD